MSDVAKQVRRISAMFTDNQEHVSSDGMLNIECPFCGYFYVHCGQPESGDDERMGGMKQGTLVIPFWGECGHRWDLIFGEHKGNTYAKIAFASLDPLSPPDTIKALDERLP